MHRLHTTSWFTVLLQKTSKCLLEGSELFDVAKYRLHGHTSVLFLHSLTVQVTSRVLKMSYVKHLSLY